MNTLLIYSLKILRKLYSKVSTPKVQHLEYGSDPEVASGMIYNLLSSGEPCMIARYGSTELSAIANYMGIKEGRDVIGYIKGESSPWWWNASIMQQMQQWSGFFPPTADNLTKFSELMLRDSSEVDILGCWNIGEHILKDRLSQASTVHLRLLEPFWTEQPWSRYLEDKRVVVVHPFAQTIMRQYNNRENIFDNKSVLPEFASLRVVKAVQSLGGECDFEDWFEALDWMKSEIFREDFDICLLACGAYGFPLAAYVKSQGKQAIHLGGALQLLFGIRGKRWEDPNYGVKVWGVPMGAYSSLINENWVRPNEAEVPKNAQQIEGACYW